MEVMKKIFAPVAAALLFACSGASGDDDPLNLTSRFNGTWSIYEKVDRDADGNIVYHAIPWGGLVAVVKERNMPVDWSAYEAVTVEFAEPTKVETQLLVANRYKAWGKVGSTSLTCRFDGQDVTAVDNVTLQTTDTAVVVVKRLTLTPIVGVWKTVPLRTVNCEFGDWANGFSLQPYLFADATAGDKLEILYKTDTSNPDVGDWLIKTILLGTDSTLEGNRSELNRWNCAPVGRKSTVYRITLTEADVANLRSKGLFINGRYVNVSQCNLLKQEDDSEDGEDEDY